MEGSPRNRVKLRHKTFENVWDNVSRQQVALIPLFTLSILHIVNDFDFQFLSVYCHFILGGQWITHTITYTVVLYNEECEFVHEDLSS